jgi:hypothetical protein
MALNIQTHTNISGSYIVVQFLDNWEWYLDARKDSRYPNYSSIEEVRCGKLVKVTRLIHNDEAPEFIINRMRQIAAGHQ